MKFLELPPNAFAIGGLMRMAIILRLISSLFCIFAIFCLFFIVEDKMAAVFGFRSITFILVSEGAVLNFKYWWILENPEQAKELKLVD